MIRNFDINNAEKMYDSGLSLAKIAKKLDISTAFLFNKFKQYGIETRKRRYVLDESTFNIDNEKSYYWAGFIAADGCIYKNKLEIGLSDIDATHIEKFVSFIKTNKPIEYRSKTKSCRIVIGSKKMCNSLKNKFNISERKSLTLRFPKISSNLKKHFIRGYFDGDGSFFTTNNRIFLSFVGTKDMMLNISKTISNKFDIHIVEPYKTEKIYRIIYCDNNAINIMNWLYEGSSIYLSRKYEKFQSIIGD